MKFFSASRLVKYNLNTFDLWVRIIFEYLKNKSEFLNIDSVASTFPYLVFMFYQPVICHIITINTIPCVLENLLSNILVTSSCHNRTTNWVA